MVTVYADPTVMAEERVRVTLVLSRASATLETVMPDTRIVGHGRGDACRQRLAEVDLDLRRRGLVAGDNRGQAEADARGWVLA